MSVQWFPGHMNKARREIEKVMPQVDVVIEVLDARIPDASQNPMLTTLRGDVPVLRLLNKKDLADKKRLALWLDHWKDSDSIVAHPFSTQDKSDVTKINQWVRQMVPHRGTAEKPIRAMIAGIPNVGKSSLMNALLGKRVAKVGNEPAVTKAQQKLKVTNGFQVLDTPGILWPKIENPDASYRLAVTGAVRDTAIDYEEVALAGLVFFINDYNDELVKRYKLKTAPKDPDDTLNIIGSKRGALRSGGVIDVHKAAEVFLSDVRSGAIGPYVMETPDMVEQEWQKVEEVKAKKEAERQARLAAAVPQRQQEQNKAHRDKRSDEPKTE
ncbi:ribosome biogenesis GTPase YlqF [Marinomonas mediterranea]|uniref:Ribosome biogenesis GTPase A n=1 Tax=Marinomonas mediterranea (strain ATCC 700492 / JCM 21426 / NBRC 103028 / MMB-1) TaxID=717774 RepID=F2JZW3_MARM1|nr:ribosome biogenesis GTPase YlqF [Marinomonas mediterranea]ADZ92075.1 ribosome biogenesis GTP-binding protein YlqF [Marinomonas mediterranea MMB-1]WCN10037.1 ribosome biogenesis GTPase YlqF [Marinomonas mediterranea]WCN14087.1 ribosome biogenesis GTPase YlqF [Marinomonas mediterranea]WCN18143.1 ribosome biogenesis GTPase YlqF [Marinomonas mediterranea MMB-1]